MDMMSGDGRALFWIAVAGLIGMLAMGGCAKKSVVATTSGAEASQAGAGSKADGGAGGSGGGMAQPRDTQAKADKGTSESSGGGSMGSGGGSTGSGSGSTGSGSESPLQGIAKSPKEEAVKSPPMMVAKADQAEIEARKARETAQRRLADIYFAFDKWALTDEGKKNLTQSAEALKQIPNIKLLIEGHCDERGSREYNLVLGEKRAKEAERFLSGLGITNPVSVTSFGKERPVCTERDESCYWKNRRAHLVLEDAK
jgi:peptidoglycan-associated lipoprotein